MFENVRIKSGIDKESGDCNIYLSWRWVFDNNYEKPKCNIFCFGVEQETLLSNYIFREQDIISWFKEKYVDFESENKHELLRSFSNNPQYHQSCQMRHIVFAEGGNINHTQTLFFNSSEKSKVFLVCIYDDTNLQAKVIAIDSDEQIDFNISIEKTRPIFGEKFAKLKDITGDGRQKILVVQTGRTKTFSMIPPGADSYYLDSEFLNIDKNSVQVKYLSDCI